MTTEADKELLRQQLMLVSHGHLKGIQRALIAHRAELFDRQGKWLDDWKERRISRPYVERKALAEEIQATAAELQMVSEALKSRIEEEKRDDQATRLERWHWSDHMVAALSHLLESNGHAELITTARRMVSAGWPHCTPGTDRPT